MATQPEVEELQPLSLRQNVAWSFTGNVVYAACQWGTVVAVARLGSAEMLGQYALALAITGPVIMLANLQLREVQATDASGEHSFSDYFGLRIITTAMALLVLIGIALFAGYPADTRLVLLAVAVAAAFEALSDIIYGLLTKCERLDRMAFSVMIKGPFALLSLGLGVYLTGSVFWGAAALAAVMAARFFGFDLDNARMVLQRSRGHFERRADQAGEAEIAPRFEAGTVRTLALLSLPLGFVVALGSLGYSIPQYSVEFYLGERELGIFSALVYFEAVGRTAIRALGHSATPKLAQYYFAARMSEFYALLLKLLLLAAIIGIAGIAVTSIWGVQIAELVYGEEFARHPQVFLWVMVAAAILYLGSMIGCANTATRKFRKLVVPRIFVIVSVVALCLTLIPRYGLLGAAWTLCGFGVAECVAGVIVLFMTRRPPNGPAEQRGK
ncbi:MAG: lipopolysaccharide biosynthesis protein [candidate division WS1 bacterium]|jgi:O-antigen/teichoic acid export membrane protein|nr:lipopolysaccharide biosynthesis protein [candidate division WS1 bacterium]